MLTAAIRTIRPTAYLFTNLVEPEYVRSAIESELFARMPADRLRRVVRKRLHRYLRYCLTYSKHWQERWPAECREFGEEDAEDVLASLAPLTKEDLRHHGSLLRIEPTDRARRDGYPPTPGQVRNYSGGSTGMPTEVWQDLRFVARNRAIIDYAYRAVGIVPGRPTFYLWGSNNELSDIQATRRKRVSTWVRGLIPMPAYALGRDKALRYAQLINERKDVDGAVCFVSALDSFLALVEHEGYQLRRISRVVTGGGKLRPELRDRIQRLWADDVFEIYGARDCGMMGAEAPDHDGIEVYPWHTYVEVLDSGRRVGPGEEEIYVTCLQNYSFALLRMATGDAARYQEARFGWNRSRIADIIGRNAEHLMTANGLRIDPSAVIHLIGVLEARPWVRRFQLVQNGPAALTLRLETWSRPGTDELSDYGTRISEALGRIMGTSVDMRTELLDLIPPTASGKHLYCVGWSPPS